MSRYGRRRPRLVHPEADAIDILDVLHALAEPTRMAIVQALRVDSELACGTFPVDVAPSTLTHHFRVLREAGVIRQRDDGQRRWTALRRDELDTRFPGLLDTVIDAYTRQRTGPRSTTPATVGTPAEPPRAATATYSSRRGST